MDNRIDLGHSMQVYEVRPRKDKRGVDLISDAVPFGRLSNGESNTVSNAIDCAKLRRRSHDAVICVYDEAGKCDRNARARGRFQGVVSRFVSYHFKAAFPACPFSLDGKEHGF